jgi:hypothetical protein
VDVARTRTAGPFAVEEDGGRAVERAGADVRVAGVLGAAPVVAAAVVLRVVRRVVVGGGVGTGSTLANRCRFAGGPFVLLVLPCAARAPLAGVVARVGTTDPARAEEDCLRLLPTFSFAVSAAAAVSASMSMIRIP